MPDQPTDELTAAVQTLIDVGAVNVIADALARLADRHSDRSPLCRDYPRLVALHTLHDALSDALEEQR